ncbi:amino acid transporter [Aminobacter sp. MDW-2]|uniref:nucleotidyltransferase domain-containing protein n=1 Tax=Aminobacter sp. MDW-2 TaxID=2666139 RepID=UPI0012AEECBF|nr:amino acid transporter [Aminobacter sp. MDW-2]MRX36817.1 amino acid transporter [Aminobacter sp. MDW-2]QNH32724.1 amino acid transporter [Aminobacter sp. MDW-2]
MKQPDAPDHDGWCAWHPTELARRLTGVSVPWCVAGGWALDLWHGHQTREHEDLEFTVLLSDVPVFRRALADMEFHTAGDGIVRHLPAQSAPPAEISQVWCLDVVQHCWRVDMMIEEGSPDLWVYKRNPAISVPRADIVATTPAGISYLKPAAILLFKAKHGRPKDEVDFANALPKLQQSERSWLKHCLDLCHQGHRWAERL